jgi:hypothetical protein
MPPNPLTSQTGRVYPVPMDENEECTGCYGDEGIVRDEWHGICGVCGWDLYSSIVDAMYDDFKLGRQ